MSTCRIIIRALYPHRQVGAASTLSYRRFTAPEDGPCPDPDSLSNYDVLAGEWSYSSVRLAAEVKSLARTSATPAPRHLPPTPPAPEVVLITFRRSPDSGQVRNRLDRRRAGMLGRAYSPRVDEVGAVH